MKKFTVASCIALFLLELFLFTRVPLDPDILWHFKLGEEILETKQIITANSYSFLPGTYWLQQEWLYDVCLYLVLHYGELLGYGILYALNMVFLYVLTLRFNKNRYDFLYLFLFVVTDLAFARNRGCRPAEFSVYLVPLIMWMYLALKSKWKYLLFLCYGIFAANFHCGVLVVAIPVFLLLLLSDLVSDTVTGIKKKGYLSHILELGCLILGSFINPSGVYLFRDTFRISSLDSTQYIEEWKAYSLGYFSAVFVLSIVLSFGYILYKGRWSRYYIQRVTVLCALLVLGLVSQKAFFIFLVMWLFYGYHIYEEFLLDLLQKTKLLKVFSLFRARSVRFSELLFVVGLSLILAYYSDGFYKHGFVEYANEEVPAAILNTLKEEPDARILASYSDANWLLFNDIKCFVDTRQWPYAKELNPEGPLDELIYVSVHPMDTEALDTFFDKYRFDYVWVSKSLPLSSYMEDNPNYTCVVKVEDDTSYENIYDRRFQNNQYLYKKIR